MNFQQLKYVTAIANSGSFREAARKLYISQPSLSSAVKELEEELGTKLFIRTNKGVSLTKAGSEFLDDAQRVLNQIELMELRFKQEERKTQFSVAAQHYDFLGNAFATIVNECQSLFHSFRLFETTTMKVVEEVQKGQSELGVLHLSEANELALLRFLEKADLAYEIVGSFQTHIFLGQQHPLANKEVLEVADLNAYPQIRFTQEAGNSAYFAEDLLDIPDQESVIYTSDRSTLMNLLVNTNAYASGSGIVTRAAEKGLVLVPLAHSPENRLIVVYPATSHLSQSARQFISVLRKIIAV
ncbi:LysR family transcriptional regulator [Enterococcus canis]|uniref:LysR family transcriptional regulator n=1 Tax=Enterococcus canis TaxID=214095 RepID=A0A1L8RHR9_9ENTE|nr:LysR family transcriptional regulator [Enterococcus canis]OJG19309.1 LysR family transcriptional regulator [Enterococcus canis]